MSFFYHCSFYWSIVDLQCFVSSRCTAKWFSYTYFFQILFPYRLLQNIAYSSLCYSLSLLVTCFMYERKWKSFSPGLTLWDPMDYTVHGLLQARTSEWVAFPFSRGSSQPRDRTQVSRIAGEFFTSWAIRDACFMYSSSFTLIPNS